MSAYSRVAEKLKESIGSNDRLILIFAVITGVILVFVIISTIRANYKINKWKKNNNAEFAGGIHCELRILNTIFLTLVSIFPLLGMLGTVFGLLGLDLENGNMENIKNNFFIALTSTAWGIIFSVIFKLLYALFADWIEDKIEVTKKLSEKDDKETK